MSGNTDMRQVLKGTVRDHRIPQDYRFHYTQPSFSSTFRKNIQRWYWNRLITKQNWTQPMTVIFVSFETLCANFIYLIDDYSQRRLRSPLVSILNNWKDSTRSARRCASLSHRQLRLPAPRQCQPRQLLGQERILLDIRPKLRTRAGTKAPLGRPQRANSGHGQVPSRRKQINEGKRLQCFLKFRSQITFI